MLGHTSIECSRIVYEAGKRTLDITLSVLLLGLLAPLFALLALAVKLNLIGAGNLPPEPRRKRRPHFPDVQIPLDVC